MKKISNTLIAIILDDVSQIKLLDLLDEFYANKTQYDDWVIRGEHVTLVFGIPSNEQLTYVGKTVKMEVKEFGFNDDAIAAKVKFLTNGIKSKNKIPHVTLAFDRKTGKGGAESNNIKNWVKVHEPILISGVVKMGHDIIKK